MKHFKLSFLIIGFMLILANVGWGQYSGTGTFTKINSLSDLTDGYYVIAYGTTFAMSNTNAGTYFGNTAITPSSNTITDPATTIVWKIQTHIDGGRTIYSENSSKYVSYTGSSNAAYAVASVTSGAQRWTFAWTGTLFTVTNVTSTTRLLQYNTSSPRFACYTGSQQNITLYKMAATGSTPPTLTPDATSNTVDNNIDITFTDNATWRAAITAVKIGGTSLAAGDYTLSAGNLQLKPSNGNALLTISGSKSVTVEATGYSTASVTQVINPGAPTKLVIKTEPSAPATNGAVLGTQPAVYIQDQYGNTTTSTAIVTASVGAGSWTLGGTTSVNGVNGTVTYSGLTATSIASVTGATISFNSTGLTGITSATFNIPEPVTDYISLTGNTYSQDFNTLVNNGTSSTLPQGWYILETGSNANISYTAGTGSSTVGDCYSFGSAENTERCLGGLQSGSLIPSWGGKFKNETGITITNITVTYTGETWRVGSENRIDRIDFQYSTDATSLSSGTWADVDLLDYQNPGQSTGSGSLQHSSNLSYTITGLNISNGSTFWIRWTDFNASSSDDGMGIDDFSIATNLSEGDVYISHISPMYQTESDEFVVLFNNNDYEIDLQGYQLISYDAAGSNSNTFYNFVESKKIPARKHLLLSSNVLVNVGSVNKMSDLQFTSNLNSPGGQIILRQTSKPTNIIFAAAWGTISNYVAGMTNSAPFSSAGMIRLTANGTTYIYNGGMAMNFSNESYSYVTSSEISELPNSGNDPLPVVLSSFNSVYFSRKVLLNWVTSEENNNTGFDIERKQLNGEWSKIGFVNGNGTKYSESNYSFEDRNLQSGKYQYRLKQIDYNGNFEYFNLDGEVEVGVPSKFDLSQNYPNPFNPVTKINYDLPVSGQVSLKVYDMIGKEVASVVNEYKEAGYHTVSFDASKLTSGVYFYKLTAGNNSAVKKLVVLK